MAEDDIAQWVEARLRDKEMQHLQVYLSNGRKLQEIPSSELRKRWIMVIGRMLDSYEAGSRFESMEREDIEAELTLRKELLPKPEGNVVARINALGRRMQQRLSEQLGLAANFQDIADDIKQMKLKAKKLQN